MSNVNNLSCPKEEYDISFNQFGFIFLLVRFTLLIVFVVLGLIF